jgi:hypothetical protein
MVCVARIYRLNASQAQKLGVSPAAGCFLVAPCEVCGSQFTAVRRGIPADGESVVEVCRRCGAPCWVEARYVNVPTPPRLEVVRDR